MPREGATTTIEPLISTTENSALMSAFMISQQPNPIAMLDRFESQGKSFDLAVRVSGPVERAFPEGPPEAVLEAAEADAARHALPQAHKAAASPPTSAVPVGGA